MEPNKIFISDLKVGDRVFCKEGFTAKSFFTEVTYAGQGYIPGRFRVVDKIINTNWNDGNSERCVFVVYEGEVSCKGVYEICLEKIPSTTIEKIIKIITEELT